MLMPATLSLACAPTRGCKQGWDTKYSAFRTDPIPFLLIALRGKPAVHEEAASGDEG
jgi:hypothetical protein